MPLSTADISTLSRLLDEAMDLAAGDVERWLAALPPHHRPFAPRLREMLAQYSPDKRINFMAQGPRLAAFEPEAAVAREGARVGPYRLLRLLGRGGMATVWLAERDEGGPRRAVALKMPLWTLGTRHDAERFERERDVLARLEHPHIARLYDAGVTPAGQPFIVLEHVDGQSIHVFCDTRRWGIDQRLRLFLKVLEAIDHAHKHLIVHRDIKPANVFVDDDGHVKLLDFGIAKLLDDHANAAAASTLTRDAGCAMTPRYAAPEQIDRKPVSVATDVYSLGVLLYELLCGASAYGTSDHSLANAVHAVLHVDPVPPSGSAIDKEAARVRGLRDPGQLRAALRGDLDTIVLKALRKSPTERYGSVERFADDIRRHLAHLPIGARPQTPWHRGRLFVRRHRAASLVAACGVVTSVTLGAMAWQQHVASLQQGQRAEAVRDFMFDLVEDAEVDENHPEIEPTGRQMIAGAIRRARSGFAGQPRLRGELLAELGRMRGRLGDADDAAAVQRDALALLEANAPPGDGALNKARARVADLRLQHGDNDGADTLARTVLRDCRQGRDCAKARMYADTVLGNIALRRGRGADGLAWMKQAATESAEGFGARDAQTGLALLNLAIVARQSGQGDAAREALDRALDIGRDATLRLSDRIDLWRTEAVLDLDEGHYARARDELRELLTHTPAKPEQAEQLRLLATAQLALGDAIGARQSAESALAIASDDSRDVEPVLARQAHARALFLQGDAKAAQRELAEVITGLQAAGYAAHSMEVLRARRYLAEAKARDGEFDLALDELRRVAIDQASFQAGQRVERAATLDLVGCLARERGLAGESQDAHSQARQLLEAGLHADHPLRQRNALYLDALAWHRDRTPAAESAFAAALDAYVSSFPAGSSWATIAREAAATTACPRGALSACVLIL